MPIVILTGMSATSPAAVAAFKEWAVIVQALLAGEQIVDVRKGGLQEESRHFDVRSQRFWLYPTSEHQRAELLKPAYRHWIDLAPGSPAGDAVTVPGWAEIVARAPIDEPEALVAIDDKLIWTLDYAESRLRWKRRDPLWVLALRVHRLAEPITIAWDDAYGGCTSWVDLAGLPPEPTAVASEPALSDTAFEARLNGLADALPTLESAVA